MRKQELCMNNDEIWGGIDTASDPAVAAFRQGLDLFRLGRMEQAAARLERATQIRSDFPQAARALGLVLTAIGGIRKEAGHVQEAAACYSRAAQVDPVAASAWNNWGVVLLEQGDPSRAADLFRKAIGLDASFDTARTNLALSLEAQGDFEASAAAVEDLVAVRPGHGQGWRHLGLMRFHRGDLPGATEALWRGLCIDPDMDGIDRIFLVLLEAGIFFGRWRETAPGTWCRRLHDLAPRSPLAELLDSGVRSLTPDAASVAWQRTAQRLEATQSVVVMNPKPDVGPRTRHPSNISVLLNFGRSGTGFLHSLIDEHPHVATMPGIYMKDFFSKGVWEAVADPNPAIMAENFCSLYEVLFDARIAKNVPGNNHPANFPIGVSEGFTRMGEYGTEFLGLDRQRFHKHLADLLAQDTEMDSGRFFTRVHSAFEITLGRNPSPELLFYHIHNPDQFAFINFLRQFPECRILMIVRQPLQSLESWVSKIMDEPGAYPGIINRVVRMLFSVDRTEFRMFPSAGVRLEDLKRDPDKTLARLCAFLGIGMAESLRRSTMQGLRWWGDPGSVRIEGETPFGQLSDDPTARNIGAVFSASDQLVLETLFYPFSRRFGYDTMSGTEFQSNLKRIRPLLERPFDFERNYFRAFPKGLVPLERNLFSGYLRRLLIIRWETLKASGTYPCLLDPL
jgi:tetratricopeptide (TPR) repeat protein